MAIEESTWGPRARRVAAPIAILIALWAVLYPAFDLVDRANAHRSMLFQVLRMRSLGGDSTAPLVGPPWLLLADWIPVIVILLVFLAIIRHGILFLPRLIGTVESRADPPGQAVVEATKRDPDRQMVIGFKEYCAFVAVLPRIAFWLVLLTALVDCGAMIWALIAGAT